MTRISFINLTYGVSPFYSSLFLLWVFLSFLTLKCQHKANRSSLFILILPPLLFHPQQLLHQNTPDELTSWSHLSLRRECFLGVSSTPAALTLVWCQSLGMGLHLPETWDEAYSICRTSGRGLQSKPSAMSWHHDFTMLIINFRFLQFCSVTIGKGIIKTAGSIFQTIFF